MMSAALPSRRFVLANPDPTEPLERTPISSAHIPRPLPHITTTVQPRTLALPSSVPALSSGSSSSRSSPAFDSTPSPDTPESPSGPSQLNAVIMVTTGDRHFVTIELNGAKNGAVIREVVYSQLQIPDEEYNVTNLYTTDVLDQSPHGKALNDDELFALCKQQGDMSGNLHFRLISTGFTASSSFVTSTPVHTPTMHHPIRTKSSDLNIDSLSLEASAGYEAGDEGVQRRGHTTSSVNNKLAPREHSYSPPTTTQPLNGYRGSHVHTGIISPPKPPRALPPQPGPPRIPTHARTGSDQPGQLTGAGGVSGLTNGHLSGNDRLLAGGQIPPRPSSSLGTRVSPVWPGSPSAEPNVRPPPRVDSIESQLGSSPFPPPTPPKNRVPPVSGPPSRRRGPPSVPPPQPPAGAAPFKISNLLSPATYNVSSSQRSTSNGLPPGAADPRMEQFEARLSDHHSYVQPSQVQWYAPSNASSDPYNSSQSRPSPFSQRSPTTSTPNRVLVGARSFSNLRDREREQARLPFRPTPTLLSTSMFNRASPAPIQTAHPRADGLPSASFQPSSANSTSPLLQSPIAPLPAPSNRKSSDGYRKRPSTADTAADAMRLLPSHDGLRRSPAVSVSRPSTGNSRLPGGTSVSPNSVESLRQYIPSRPAPPSSPRGSASLYHSPRQTRPQQAASSVNQSPIDSVPPFSLDDGIPSSAALAAQLSDASNGRSRQSPGGFSPRPDEATLRGQDYSWLPPMNLGHAPLSLDTGTARIASGRRHPSPQAQVSTQHITFTDSSSSEEESDEESATLWQHDKQRGRQLDEAWLTRPQPEDVYERLEKYFPHHNLDEPMIDPASSPTAVESSQPFPVIDSKQERHRISIRRAAHERQNKLLLLNRPLSKADASIGANDLVGRRRSTKLWGSKVEELPEHAQAGDVPPVPALPRSASGHSTNTFQWVRGDLIGKGTYGRVYLALIATTGEMLAVKQVEKPKTISDQDDTRQKSVVEALKSESATLSKLDHPHVVQYLGMEETPDVLSIFLEYVPGGSVGSCLRKYGKFDDSIIKSFTGHILDGLAYLHSVGVLHRDLKADNILVDPSGVCKISDFGISKQSDNIYNNETNTAMQGSIFWMAPEVLENNHKGYSHKIDIWSLGCVVLEMWAGRRPWDEQNMFAVMFQLGAVKQAPPVPPDVQLDDVAEDFRQKCFAINPADRPTAAQLLDHSYLTLPESWTFPGFEPVSRAT